MFHTYIDWTNDGRPFYIGMSDDNRINRLLGRNKHHTHIVHKHGQRRELVLSTNIRQETVDLEIKLIAEHHTFKDDPAYNGIGCNYTSGGEGRPCSKEMKQKMRDVINAQYANGREPWNKGKHGLTYNFSEEHREKARRQLIAFNQTRPMLGKHHTDDTKARMRKPHICSICRISGHTKTTCVKRPVTAVNMVQIAQRKRYQNEP